jgi:hypothetical protein
MTFLTEAQNYEAMFNSILRMAKDFDETREPKLSDNLCSTRYCEHIIKENLDWAKRVLKKSDRIIWWMRYIKAQLLDYVDHSQRGAGGHWLLQFDPNSVNTNGGGGGFTYGQFGTRNSRPAQNLEHYMSLDCPAIQNFVFGKKPNADVFLGLNALEEEWKETGARHIPQDHPNNADAEILIDYGDMVWLDLQRASCDREGAAMRHCGNSPRSHTEDTIISLRSHVAKGGKPHWEPHLTFTRDEYGYLQERKARGNSKPPAQLPSHDCGPAAAQAERRA